MAKKDVKVRLSDYRKRLKDVYDKQTSLELREACLTKKVSKIYENFMTAREAGIGLQRDSKWQRVIQQHRQELEERLSIEEQLAKELEATKQRNLGMREQLKQRRSQAKQITNEMMECIHTLKESTGTYINQEALPARVKGVTVRRGTDRDQWIPFDLASTDTEGLESLFQQLQTADVDEAKWRQLVSLAADISTESSRSPSTPRKDNGKCNPIIEIDLTSPTSQS